jgi:valyl-tRNA synthetase
MIPMWVLVRRVFFGQQLPAWRSCSSRRCRSRRPSRSANDAAGAGWKGRGAVDGDPSACGWW